MRALPMRRGTEEKGKVGPLLRREIFLLLLPSCSEPSLTERKAYYNCFTKKKRSQRIRRMIGSIVTFFLFCGVALADPKANQYVDNVLQTSLPQALRSLGLNPAPLPGFNTYFGPKGIYQNQGEAIYSQGNVTNLSRISRRGDCSGPKMFKGQITINCTLSLTQVTSTYKVVIRNGSHVYQPRNMGHVAETLVSVVISGVPQNYVGSVKSFRIDRMGQITPTYSGLPASLNKYLKVLQDAYRVQVSTNLYNILQNQYAYGLSTAFKSKPMPRP